LCTTDELVGKEVGIALLARTRFDNKYFHVL
jgi:hypothetical protein